MRNSETSSAAPAGSAGSAWSTSPSAVAGPATVEGRAGMGCPGRTRPAGHEPLPGRVRKRHRTRPDNDSRSGARGRKRLSVRRVRRLRPRPDIIRHQGNYWKNHFYHPTGPVPAMTPETGNPNEPSSCESSQTHPMIRPAGERILPADADRLHLAAHSEPAPHRFGRSARVTPVFNPLPPRS